MHLENTQLWTRHLIPSVPFFINSPTSWILTMGLEMSLTRSHSTLVLSTEKKKKSTT